MNAAFKVGLMSAVVLLALVGGSAAVERTDRLYEDPRLASYANQIDRLVFSKVSAAGMKPVLCSDEVFVRRAYLDVLGVMPSAKEAAAFIREGRKPGKRTALIDQLLKRDEFASYWAMKWGDVLRIKAEFPVNLWPNGAQAYHRWVLNAIAENKPYDRFARELLTSSGSNFRVGPVNFYRAVQNKTPEGLAAAVALVFMGARTDAWPEARAKGLAAFFSEVGFKPTSEWKEEVVFWDALRMGAVPGNTAPGQAAISTLPPKQPAGASTKPAGTPTDSAKAPREAVFPDGTRVKLPLDRDPRAVFADWLISPKNPWFARAIVNRVWAWLLGRGIVHEPDDIREDNPPSNPALLAYLEKEFISSGYDLKRLYRLILTSNTYQMSSVPRYKDPRAEALFATYPLRRLDAEVLIDAINSITGSSDLYTSPIPEPFTYIPRDVPAVSIADGSITSPFLALFGRSARATGMMNERTGKPIPAQALHMLNSSHIQEKLEKGWRLKSIVTTGQPPRKIADELYLTILSRFPTTEETRAVEDYPRPGAKKTLADWIDVAWSLINSPEFLYRH